MVVTCGENLNVLALDCDWLNCGEMSLVVFGQVVKNQSGGTDPMAYEMVVICV